MAMIQVTSAKLKAAAQELQNLNGQFKNKAQELSGKEHALCQMWEGKAKDAFHTAYTRDYQQIEVFTQLIGQYIQVLSEIAERYEQAERRNAEIAGSRSY